MNKDGKCLLGERGGDIAPFPQTMEEACTLSWWDVPQVCDCGWTGMVSELALDKICLICGSPMFKGENRWECGCCGFWAARKDMLQDDYVGVESRERYPNGPPRWACPECGGPTGSGGAHSPTLWDSWPDELPF